MPSELRVQGKLVIASLYAVSAGKEQTVYRDYLTRARGRACVFKALGQFDVALIQDAPLYDEDVQYMGVAALSPAHVISLIQWDGVYTSPDVTAWLSGFPVAGLLFLELDKTLYLNTPSCRPLLHLLDRLHRAPECAQLAVYGGLGNAELIGLLRADSFADLFTCANFLRSLRQRDVLAGDAPAADKPVFSSTRTVPLISYQEVVSSGAFHRIRGQTSASILVRCPPGLEQTIAQHLVICGDTPWRSVLGTQDMIMHFPQHIPSRELVKSLLQFRDFCGSIPGAPLIRTETTLIHDLLLKQQLVAEERKPFEPYEQLEREFVREHPGLAQRVLDISKRIESAVSVEALRPVMLDMEAYPQNILASANSLATGESSAQELAKVRTMLDLCEIGLAQRLSSKIAPDYMNPFRTSGYADGVSASIFAIDCFIRFVCNAWTATSATLLPQHIQWNGFILFSDSDNFGYHAGEVFTLPSAAILEPFGVTVNWLTLTHEISHAFFTRMQIDVVERSVVEATLGELFETAPDAQDEKLAWNKLLDTAFELFANWFDYYHFYDREHAFFQKAIWSSWCVLPVVEADPLQYVFRGFMVSVLQDLDRLRSAHVMDRLPLFFDDSWRGYLDFVKAELPQLNNTYNMDDFESGVQDLFEKLASLMLNLVSKYPNEEFRKLVNTPYANLDSHVAQIACGVVVCDAIDNPFVLVKKCRKAFPNELPPERHIAAARALILSLRNGAGAR